MCKIGCNFCKRWSIVKVDVSRTFPWGACAGTGSSSRRSQYFCQKTAQCNISFMPEPACNAATACTQGPKSGLLAGFRGGWSRSLDRSRSRVPRRLYFREQPLGGANPEASRGCADNGRVTAAHWPRDRGVFVTGPRECGLAGPGSAPAGAARCGRVLGGSNRAAPLLRRMFCPRAL
jgi:hypothetical protein